MHDHSFLESDRIELIINQNSDNSYNILKDDSNMEHNTNSAVNNYQTIKNEYCELNSIYSILEKRNKVNDKNAENFKPFSTNKFNFVHNKNHTDLTMQNITIKNKSSKSSSPFQNKDITNESIHVSNQKRIIKLISLLNKRSDYTESKLIQQEFKNKIQKQWALLAKIFDRLLWYMFVVLTTITLGTIIIQTINQY